MTRSGATLALVVALGVGAGAAPCHAIANSRGTPDRDRTIVVSVLDQKGAPIADLTPEDLVVRENGVAREVLRVRKATAPLTIAFMVDDSAASRTAMMDIRQGVDEFVGEMAGRNDIALLSFGERPTIVVPYTRDKAALVNGAKRLFYRDTAGAYFLEAIRDAARGLQKRSAERPVIISVMTEGVEFSTLGYETVLDELYKSGAQFHALVLSEVTAANQMAQEIRYRNIVLDEGTRSTGGRREQLLASSSVPFALKQLAAELGNQYLVTYARPETLIQPDKVQVEAKRPGLTVRARTRPGPNQ